MFDRSQNFLDYKRGMTEAQPSHVGSAASLSKAKPNNIDSIHSSSMMGRYNKHRMSTTSKFGGRSIRRQDSRVSLLFPPFSWHCVHWQCSAGSHHNEEPLEITTKLQNSTPDKTISHGRIIKQLRQCESLEKVATGRHMPISTA